MQVYADNAATTRMHQTAIDTMTYHLNNTFGNPSSLYTIGQQAKEVLETARADMAACFGAQPREIYFTSGGSEADNQAITSAAYLGARKGKKHIISTTFEHHAVLHTLKRLEKQGFEVTLLDVHADGVVRVEDVAAALRDDTCLVTVMFAVVLFAHRHNIVRLVKGHELPTGVRRALKGKASVLYEKPDKTAVETANEEEQTAKIQGSDESENSAKK